MIVYLKKIHCSKFVEALPVAALWSLAFVMYYWNMQNTSACWFICIESVIGGRITDDNL